MNERERACVLDLYCRCFDDTRAAAEAVVGYAFAHGEVHVLDAEAGADSSARKIASMLCYAPLEDSGFKAAYLFAAATDPAYRGRGLFRENLRRSAAGRRLICIPENENLWSMYESLGFSQPVCATERLLYCRGRHAAPEYGGPLEALYPLYLQSPIFPKKDLPLFVSTLRAFCIYGGRIYSDGACAVLARGDMVFEVYGPEPDAALRLAERTLKGEKRALLPADVHTEGGRLVRTALATDHGGWKSLYIHNYFN